MKDQLEKSAETHLDRPSATRRDLLQGSMLLSAAALTVPFATACARAAEPAPPANEQSDKNAEKSLYERLGGIFAIAGVVNYFSDEIIKDPTAGARSSNPALRKWHTESLDRLPGLKFMRTLWVANVSGGPFKFSATKPGKTELG